MKKESKLSLKGKELMDWLFISKFSKLIILILYCFNRKDKKCGSNDDHGDDDGSEDNGDGSNTDIAAFVTISTPTYVISLITAFIELF